jgi:cytochrome c oxidase subunit 2
MKYNLPLFPEQASTAAPQVDALYFFLIAVSAFFIVLIFFLVIYFAARYRRRSEAEIPDGAHENSRLEMLWTIIPFGLTMIMFSWGASLYFDLRRVPEDTLEIYVLGKRWM